MNNDERDRVIQQIAIDAATTRAEVSGVTEALRDIFQRLRQAELAVKELEARQDDCPAREAYTHGAKQGEVRNILALLALIVAVIALIANWR